MTARSLTGRILRRPLLTSTTALAVTAAVAAGVSVSTEAPNSAAAAGAIQASGYSVPAPAELDPRPIAAQQRLAISAATHRKQVAVQRAAAKKALAKKKAVAAKKAEQRAEARRAAAARDAAREARVSRSSTRGSISGGSAKSVARAMVADRGWGSGEFGCLESLWQKESGWSVQAENPSSGAYGIPQALPGSKMASAGSDWRTNASTQIEWGLGYISDRYGSPCDAWGHSQNNGWY